jgi:phosphoribosylaminoimidazole-succinocarboxamide synthase
MAKRLGLNEGMVLSNTVYELCYKSDELDDPIINEHHAVLFKAATYEELEKMNQIAKKVNEILVKAFDEVGVILVDLKLEFGKTADGQILLCDEISPDTARMWDKETKVKLDKDRFRRDLGDIYAAYEEVYNRLQLVK